MQRRQMGEHVAQLSPAGRRAGAFYEADTDPDSDDAYRPARMPRSARRLDKQPLPPPKRKPSWVLSVATGMALMLILYAACGWLGTWWADHQLDATYGMPRTYQVDAVVGHEDSSGHPSHFIFLNLEGRGEIIELPGGQPTHLKVYDGPLVFADNPARVPVTGEFRNVDGTEQMLVHVQNQTMIYVSDGTKFIPR